MRRNPTGANLIVRRDGVICSICGDLVPVHPGDGTPLPALLVALEDVRRRHPDRKHPSFHPRSGRLVQAPRKAPGLFGSSDR